MIDAPIWNRRTLGSGPIALAMIGRDPECAAADHFLLVAATSNAGIVNIGPAHVGDFLEKHTGGSFVSIDVGRIFHRLLDQLQVRGDAAGLAALAAVSRQRGWIDLRLLDRQIRYATGDDDFRLRDWPSLARLASVARSEKLGVGGGPDVHLTAEDLPLMLAVYDQLRQAALKLRQDCEGRLQPPIADAGDQPAPTPDEHPGPGIGIEVWGAIALNCHARGGLLIDRSEAPRVEGLAESEYRRSSAEIGRLPQLRGCFEWDRNEVARDKKGFPKVKPEELAEFLQQKVKVLCDNSGYPASVPHKNGRPSLNPELWGFWAACDSALWFWRHLFRMAEIARLGRSTGTVCPRYETLPALRSCEPNLTAYRTHAIPVFRAREGCVLVAGVLPVLRIRCLAAVCLHHQDRPLSASLPGDILSADNPIDVAAERLRASSFPAASASGEDLFWFGLTKALLETIPLNLPDPLLTAMLRNGYGINLAEADTQLYRRVLMEDVVPALASFLEDTTLERVARKMGETPETTRLRLSPPVHPETLPPRLRRQLRREKRLRADAAPPHADRGEAEVGLPRSRQLKYRAETLGGRVTRRAHQADVRREELLLAEDDVMLAVAHALVSSGYQLLGIAGEEFVLEVPASEKSAEVLEQICAIAHNAASLLLLPVPVQARAIVVELW